MQRLTHFAPALALLCLLCGWTQSVNALTNADIAGTYLGTSVATLPTGGTVSATVNITFQPKGTVRTISSVNGIQSTVRGKYHFLADNIVTGTFPESQFVSFVSLDGDTLTFNLLIQKSDGTLITEKTTAHRIN